MHYKKKILDLEYTEAKYQWKTELINFFNKNSLK